MIRVLLSLKTDCSGLGFNHAYPIKTGYEKVRFNVRNSSAYTRAAGPKFTHSLKPRGTSNWSVLLSRATIQWVILCRKTRGLVSRNPQSKLSYSKLFLILKLSPTEMWCDTRPRLFWVTRTFSLEPLVIIYPDPTSPQKERVLIHCLSVFSQASFLSVDRGSTESSSAGSQRP